MAKILLVEDDNNLREIFELRLIAEGYQTVTAGNGEEALVVAMKEKPDLIIADVMMPKLSGFEMLETLRAAPEMAATKCIMMTALGQAEDRARGERLGVIKYLVKSQVTLEDFVKVVRGVVPPDGAATPGSSAAPAAAPTNSQSTTNQGSEDGMQPDNQAPADGGATPNPINDDAATPDQQSASQEQSQVQDQINNFVSSAPAGGPPSTTTGDSPAPAPAADGSGDNTGPSTDPAADTGAGPNIPMSTAPAPEAPAAPSDGTQPEPSNTL